MKLKHILSITAVAAAASLTMVGCSASNTDAEPAVAETVAIGSAAFPESEIIGEIYAQALEGAGYTVEREFNIGSREIYIPAIESGEVDLLPEYTGNLLLNFDPETTAKTADEVYAALPAALEPSGLSVLDQSTAADQDSYNVTAEFSKKYNVTSLEDLAKVSEPLTLGGNSELATRPYGPEGLKSVYGVSVGFTAIEDSGGPLTIKALKDNVVQLVDIYSTDPSIKKNDLVTLADPKALFLPQNVVALINTKEFPEGAAEIVNAVNKALTTEGLIELNTQSSDGDSAEKIATAWLKANKIG